MADLRDAEDALANALRRLSPHTPFAEAMAERSSGGRLRFDRSETLVTPEPRLDGAVIRAWAGTVWVEAASSGLDRASVNATADSLEQRLKKRSDGRPAPGESSTLTGERVAAAKKPIGETSTDDLRAAAKRLFDTATSVDGVKNTLVRMEWQDDERLYVSTAGARVYQRVPHARAGVIPLAMENGKVEYDFLSEGRTGGWEVLDLLTDDRVRASAELARNLLAAPSPPSGSMPVLLDPTTAGTFAHESFGHGTEADQIVRERSYLAPLLGQMVGPKELTIVDDGSLPGAWGSTFFDDEGHATRRTVLIDQGRFVGALHDRVSAAALHAEPTGNTRRADFLSRPYVRMTNTFVESGDWSLDELVEEAKDGVLLECTTSGIEDPLGGQMQIKVKRARRIEKGSLGGLVSSMALSGKVLDFLKGIRGVGRSDAIEIGPGFCGKGHTDLLPAGTGGPYLLSEAVVGPA